MWTQVEQDDGRHARDHADAEALDGRLEVHGYFEMQGRTISQNFSDQWDLTQWYNVFNLELELDLVQDTHGPLDLMSAFIRIEARFDCVYSRGCGMIRSADLYGNRARNMPRRLNSGDEYTNAGSIVIKNDGPYAGPDRNPFHLSCRSLDRFSTLATPIFLTGPLSLSSSA